MLGNTFHERRILSVALIIALVTVLAAFSSENVAAATTPIVTPTVKAVAVNKNATIKSNVNVRWSVVKGKSCIRITSKSNKALKVRGLKKGTAYIQAQYGKKSETIKIVVFTTAPKKITLTSNAKKRVGGDLAVGTSCKVSVKSVSPSSACKAVTYSSSDKAVATVDANGVVTGVGRGDVVITAKSLANNKVKCRIKLHVVNRYVGTMETTVNLTDTERYPAGKIAKAWIPVPVSDDNQIISKLKYEAPSAYRKYETSDSWGNRLLYVEWAADADPATRIAKVSYHVERWEIECPDNLASKEKGAVDTEKFAAYLDTKDVSPAVKKLADEIIAGANATTVYEKAYAIYDWMADNLCTKSGSPSQTVDHVDDLLFNTKTAGGCACISYAFVEMCRIEGVPARVLYGVKLNKNSNRCHADFYLPGYGWVPADANDAIRKIEDHYDEYRGADASEENLAQWKAWKEKYFGFAYDAPFLFIAEGVDHILTPAISDTTSEDGNVVNGVLRMLDWPYVEFDGKCAISKSDKGTVYKHSFSEGVDDDEDCGC